MRERLISLLLFMTTRFLLESKDDVLKEFFILDL